MPPYILLTDGTSVTLPAPIAAAEFVLPGNARAFEQVLAFFDPTSETGAIFYRRSRVWHLLQPTTREAFFLHCGMLDALMPAHEAAAQLDASLGGHTRQ